MTISEIANMAGVSPAAVSRYFNDGYVSEEKREAIRKVVEATGYHPSLQAQTLRTKKTRMVGVIIPRVDSTSIGRVISGIMSGLEKNGYRMMLANTQNNTKKELDYLKVFDDKQVDAVILIGTIISPAHRKVINKMKIPVVLVGQHLDGCYCVYHDDFGAVKDLTGLLLSKGRKNIGFLGVTEDDVAAGRARYKGFLAAMKSAGYTERSDHHRIGEFGLQSGYDNMGELLAADPDVNAVICATDHIAVGAARYCKEQGISVPEQIMITGIGDSELAAVTTPSITSAHYYYEDTGSMAADMIVKLMKKKDVAVKEVKMGYEIVERESTGADPGHGDRLWLNSTM